jgi:alpha-galactosidase
MKIKQREFMKITGMSALSASIVGVFILKTIRGPIKINWRLLLINVLFITVLFVQYPFAIDNGVASLPPMGWNSWNHFSKNINVDIIKGIVDSIVSMGFRDAGYLYVNIDDGWMEQINNDEWVRDNNGHVITDKKKFPQGMKALGDYIKSKDMKFGIYSKWFTHGYEEIDVGDFASWGVEYNKYDCWHTHYMDESWTKMRDLMIDKGMVYSIHFTNRENVYRPDIHDLTHVFRITNDIKDSYEVPIYSWATTTTIASDRMAQISFTTRKGCYADPDMMQVGRGNQTLEEYKCQFALWCIWSAPFIMGHDVRTTTAPILEILTNPEIIAVNQDSAVNPGYRVWSREDSTEAWVKPLGFKGNERAVVLHNRSKSNKNLGITWLKLGFIPEEEASVRDLYEKKDLGTFTDSFSADVPSHSVAVLKITGIPQIIPHIAIPIYEAENAFMSEPAGIETSGGITKVTGIGGINSSNHRTGTLTLYVTAKEALSYLMNFDYMANGDKKIYVSVNGKAGVAVDCPNTTSWSLSKTCSLRVDLEKDENSIRFYNNKEVTAHLDRITFPDAITGIKYKVNSAISQECKLTGDLRRIRFFIPKLNHAQQLILQVFDFKGRVVRELINELTQGGNYTVAWDALNDSGEKAARGIYFCRLKIDNVTKTISLTRL